MSEIESDSEEYSGGNDVHPCIVCGQVFSSRKGSGQHFGMLHSESERKAALVEELERIRDKIMQVPSVTQMYKHGRIGRDAFETAFGSWSNALDAAGMGEAPEVEHTRRELIDEIKRVAEVVDRSPRRNDMRDHGEIGATCYNYRFGSWSEALEEAGFETRPWKHSRQDLLESIHRVHKRLGRPPTRVEVHEYEGLSERPFRRVFGSWNDALRSAGVEVNQRKDIPKEELLAELKRLADATGMVPTALEMDERGEYSVGPYKRVFGSWNGALRAAGFEPNVEMSRVPLRYGMGWTDEKKRAVRERDGFKCWACSCTQAEHVEQHGFKLDVHHIVPANEFSIYDPRGNSKENLMTLCRECHKEWERSIGYAPSGKTLPPKCSPPDPDTHVTLVDYC